MISYHPEIPRVLLVRPGTGNTNRRYSLVISQTGSRFLNPNCDPYTVYKYIHIKYTAKQNILVKIACKRVISFVAKLHRASSFDPLK